MVTQVTESQIGRIQRRVDTLDEMSKHPLHDIVTMKQALAGKESIKFVLDVLDIKIEGVNA